MQDFPEFPCFEWLYDFADSTIGRSTPTHGSGKYSLDSAARETVPYLVMWRSTWNSEKLHVSEPLATLAMALVEARALLAIHPFEVWIDGPGGMHLDAKEIAPGDLGIRGAHPWIR